MDTVQVEHSARMSILSEVRTILIEVVITTIWVFATIGSQIAVSSCIEACKVPESDLSSAMADLAGGCKPPTAAIQVSLASGFTAAVTTGIAFLPRRPGTWQRQSLKVTEANSGGGQLNPVVTLAVGIRGFMRPVQILFYLLAHATGAVIGAFMWKTIVDFECYHEVFTMRKPMVQQLESQLLLHAMLGLPIALVHLWAHQRLLSMGTPVLVGFAYIASTLVGFPLIAGVGGNPLRTVGLVAVGALPAKELVAALIGALLSGLLAAVLDLLIFGRTLWEGRNRKAELHEEVETDSSSAAHSE